MVESLLLRFGVDLAEVRSMSIDLSDFDLTTDFALDPAEAGGGGALCAGDASVDVSGVIATASPSMDTTQASMTGDQAGRRGFLRNVSTLAGGAAAGQLAILAAAPLLTRIYAPAEFGVFGVFFIAMASNEAPAGAAVGFVITVIGVVAGLASVKRAKAYEQAHERYKAKRQELMGEAAE